MNEERIKNLAGQIETILLEHLKSGSEGSDRILEALNVLASSAAFIVYHTGQDELIEWFSNALNFNLKYFNQNQD